MSKSTWTEREIQLLKELYPSVGVEIPEIRANHSPTAITSKASKLGVRHYAESKWSDEEIAILRDKYQKFGWHISELLKTRPKNGISAMASRLGLTRDRWSSEEIALLEDKYPTCGTNIPELLKRFGRKSIRAKAGTLGLSRAWTEPEDAEIRDAVMQGRKPNIPGRSCEAIRNRIHILGLTYNKAKSVSRREDIGGAVTVGKGYLAIQCAKCGRVYFMHEEQAMTFEHEMCATLKPVPHGWKIPRKFNSIRK